MRLLIVAFSCFSRFRSEGITLAAFLLLLVEFVSTTASNGDVKNALQRKDKEGLPMTFGLIRL